ncbi:hypothetical protein [Candidatus Lokiarchaeum ossiferum]|uniref:hypothetical protein n=1 Tax=Candidatus Lokiarchaeum ossiferum TaxID=2951803 RepID=UPI00352D61AB
MDYSEKYTYAVEMLSSFKNYLEVKDFRKFLLLILNLESMGPEAMLKQLGMGSKGKTILPYNPEKKMYFTKVMSGFSLNHQLTIYSPIERINTKFVNKSDSELFTKYLTEFERKKLLPGKFMLINPEVIDQSHKALSEKNSPKISTPGIESLYLNLRELIATQNIKFIFLLEADKADIAFIMNMNVEPSHDSENSIQYFDVYVDEKKEMRDHTFIRMKNGDSDSDEITMEFLDEIKDMSHSDLFDSHFTIIVPISSMDMP